MEKSVVCMREHHFEHAELKPARFRANTLHNRLFSQLLSVYGGKYVVLRPFHRSYLQANKESKSEGIRKVEYAYHFWSVLMLFTKNYQN